MGHCVTPLPIFTFPKDQERRKQTPISPKTISYVLSPYRLFSFAGVISCVTSSDVYTVSLQNPSSSSCPLRSSSQSSESESRDSGTVKLTETFLITGSCQYFLSAYYGPTTCYILFCVILTLTLTHRLHGSHISDEITEAWEDEVICPN